MFKPADLDNAPWKARLSAGILFFFASCLVLTSFRLFFFFLHFRSGGITFGDFWPALVMGTRVDAKWLAILLLPAWVAAVLTLKVVINAPNIASQLFYVNSGAGVWRFFPAQRSPRCLPTS